MKPPRRSGALRRGLGAWALTILTLTGGGQAVGQEGLRPGTGSPFSVRDAFPQSAGNLNLQGVLGYERGQDRTDEFRINPNLKYGLGNGLELRLSGAYALGNGSPADPGNVSTGLRWRVLDEEGWRPAVAVLGQVSFPFGPGDAGTTTELTAIVSRTTGRGPGSWGLHLNAGWLARPDPGPAERRNGYRLGGALSHVIDPDMNRPGFAGGHFAWVTPP